MSESVITMSKKLKNTLFYLYFYPKFKNIILIIH